jgi:hypothetical protein
MPQLTTHLPPEIYQNIVAKAHSNGITPYELAKQVLAAYAKNQPVTLTVNVKITKVQY